MGGRKKEKAAGGGGAGRQQKEKRKDGDVEPEGEEGRRGKGRNNKGRDGGDSDGRRRKNNRLNKYKVSDGSDSDGPKASDKHKLRDYQGQRPRSDDKVSKGTISDNDLPEPGGKGNGKFGDGHEGGSGSGGGSGDGGGNNSHHQLVSDSDGGPSSGDDGNVVLDSDGGGAGGVGAENHSGGSGGGGAGNRGGGGGGRGRGRRRRKNNHKKRKANRFTSNNSDDDVQSLRDTGSGSLIKKDHDSDESKVSDKISDGSGSGDNGGAGNHGGRSRGRRRGARREHKNKNMNGKSKVASDDEELSNESTSEVPVEQEQAPIGNPVENPAKTIPTPEAATEEERARYRLPPQRHMKDMKKFYLTTELSHPSLIQHYDERHEHNRNTYGYTMKVMRDDGSTHYIPVTPEKEPSVEDRRHFVVEYLREEDETKFRVLVEYYSRYCVAFQILKKGEVDPMTIEDPPEGPPQVYVEETGDDPSKVYWYIFQDSEGLPQRFRHRARIAYDGRYHFLQDVTFDEYTGKGLFKFLEGFRLNKKQNPTPRGHTWFDTLFVLVSEAVRFEIVQRWITTETGRIPSELPSMIKCWIKLSKCGYYILIYQIESLMAEVTGDKALALAAKELESTAKLHFAMVQHKIQGCGLEIFPRVLEIEDKVVTFEDKTITLKDVELDEDRYKALCGGLQLFRHDPVLCKRLQLRSNGHMGPVS